MASERVRIEVTGHVATVTLARADEHSASPLPAPSKELTFTGRRISGEEAPASASSPASPPNGGLGLEASLGIVLLDARS